MTRRQQDKCGLKVVIALETLVEGLLWWMP